MKKFLLILILILTSGYMGWLGGKMWLKKVSQNQLFEPINSSERVDTAKLQDQLKKLGINYQFYLQLVNDEFSLAYPSASKNIYFPEELEPKLREKWDEISTNILDKLSHLSMEACGNLGKYNQNQQKEWKYQVNQLHLSSRALYDLASARFFYWFPKATNTDSLNQTKEQVWSAIIFDTLNDLKAGKNYQKLLLNSQKNQLITQGEIKAGFGQVYVVDLPAEKSLRVNLQANQSTLISLYSPTGKEKMLEDSPQNQWAGILPEIGYYELVIVSKSDQPLTYKLKLQLEETNNP